MAAWRLAFLNFWHINGHPSPNRKQNKKSQKKQRTYFSHHTSTLSTHKFESQPTMAEAAPAGAAADLKSGPFGVLYDAVKGNTQILVNVRNNHKILARVKA